MATAQLDLMVRQLRNWTGPRALRQSSDVELLRHYREQRDQDAFAALVDRHGPLVLGVCRHVLRQDQDAEDCFQATFILLAHKAGSIRKGESLASWLHGVAYRMAKNAKRKADNRRVHEMKAVGRPHINATTETSLHELQSLLDEEVSRLAEPFRAPFVLCCLQGKSRTEAARELGCKEGTVASRLGRARQELQRRLIRRGVALSAVLAAGALTQPGMAAVPAVLSAATVKAALSYGAGQATAGVLSASVAALVKGGSKAALLGHAKIATVVMVALGLAGGGAGVWARQAFVASEQPGGGQESEVGDQRSEVGGQKSEVRGKSKPVATPKADENEVVPVKGQVVDQDGKPVAGAKLYLHYYTPKHLDHKVRTVSDKQGRFSFTFDKSEPDRSASKDPWSMVVASAEGYAADWVRIGQPQKNGEYTLRLPKEVPINGRLLDLQGKPVADAKVGMEMLEVYKADDLTQYVESFRNGAHVRIDTRGWSGHLPGQPPILRTGKDGRFCLKAIGPDCWVRLEVEGPSIQHWYVTAVTRAIKPVDKSHRLGGVSDKLYGANFDHLVRPARSIKGVVRDKATGKPVAGVEISSFWTVAKAKSDTEGRFELAGSPKSPLYELMAQPGNGQPYFSARVNVPDAVGLEPIMANIELVRGIRVRGRVIEKATGKPVKSAQVHYNALYPNPHILKLAPQAELPCSSTQTDSDGNYEAVALPGQGVIGISYNFDWDRYMPALLTTKELADFFMDGVDHGNPNVLYTTMSPNSRGLMGQDNYQALLLINPDDKTESLARDFVLEPARTLAGTIIGPDGKPVAGVQAFGLSAHPFQPSLLATGDFLLKGLNPRRSRQLFFYHKEKGLGLFKEIQGDESKPLTIRLERCGSAAGRILNKEGSPKANMTVIFERVGFQGPGETFTTTDRDGRFRINGLVPGQEYQIHSTNPQIYGLYNKPISVKPGEHKDLGDSNLGGPRMVPPIGVMRGELKKREE